MNHLPKQTRSVAPDSSFGTAFSQLKQPALMNGMPPFCKMFRNGSSEMLVFLSPLERDSIFLLLVQDLVKSRLNHVHVGRLLASW